MADRLAIILHTLSSQDNKREWRSKEKEGLTQFLNEEFLYDWKGYAVWDAGNGTVDCHYEARIVVKPTKAVSEDKELARLLAKIPFTTKEKIRDLFARRLQEYLDHILTTSSITTAPVRITISQSLKISKIIWNMM